MTTTATEPTIYLYPAWCTEKRKPDGHSGPV
jgi:hypothetical protein